MSMLFGLCMGAVIGRLVILEEYLLAIVAAIAFVMGVVLFVRR